MLISGKNSENLLTTGLIQRPREGKRYRHTESPRLGQLQGGHWGRLPLPPVHKNYVVYLYS